MNFTLSQESLLKLDPSIDMQRAINSNDFYIELSSSDNELGYIIGYYDVGVSDEEQCPALLSSLGSVNQQVDVVIANAIWHGGDDIEIIHNNKSLIKSGWRKLAGL